MSSFGICTYPSELAIARFLWGLPPLSIRSDCVYHFCEGHDATQHAAFGEAAHIAITLRMHEEAAYEGLDPIESEVRRRTFWLLFDGKTPPLKPYRKSASDRYGTFLAYSGQVYVYTAWPAHLLTG